MLHKLTNAEIRTLKIINSEGICVEYSKEHFPCKELHKRGYCRVVPQKGETSGNFEGLFHITITEAGKTVLAFIENTSDVPFGIIIGSPNDTQNLTT